MIAVDTNVLVYAHRRDASWHGPAARAVRELAEGPAAWALPWPCVHEFLAIVNLAPTPVATPEKAREIAMKKGIRYAYVGNVRDTPGTIRTAPGAGRS